MTEYAYKLVSLKARGQIDWPALERATKKGWEPVPLGEEPSPPINPLDMTPDQLADFRLCRMPKDRHNGIIQTLEQLNRGLAARWTPSLIATFRATGAWPSIETIMQQRLINEDGEEVLPEIRLTADMLTDAEMAYGWLSERGL